MVTFSRETLEKYRADTDAMRQKAMEESDKQILTLASAALGLTLTFYKDVLSQQIGNHGWLLLMAWACWSVAILSAVVSMCLSARESSLRIHHVDAALKKGGDNLQADFENATWVTRLFLDVFNWITPIAFVVGMASFASIFFLSMQH